MEDKNRRKSIALTVCLTVVGILVAAALMCIGVFAILMCTGIISVKHLLISFNWQWDFWTCLEAIGTIGATTVALFGLNLKETREKRWAVAKMVSSWISEDSKPNADGTAYVRKVIIHVNNESDEPVYDVEVNTTLDNGKHWLGPLSAPDIIRVLPAH